MQLDTIFYDDLSIKIRFLRREEGVISKVEFILVVLRLMGKLRDTDVFYMSTIFDELDRGNKGNVF